MKTIATSAAVAAALGLLSSSSSVEGFVPPEQHSRADPSTASCFRSKTSLYTASSANEDGLLVMKKGLKWILVPNAREPPKPAAAIQSLPTETTGTIPATATPVLDIVEAPPVATEVQLETVVAEVPVVEAPVVEAPVVDAPVVAADTAAAVVQPEILSSSQPMESLLPIVDGATPDETAAAAAAAATAPLAESSTTTPLVEFLPQTAERAAASSSSEATMNFEQLVQAIRENHWAKLPHVTETVPTTTAKAPLLVDILKEQSEEAVPYAEAFAGRMQASGEVLKQKISVWMDPEMFTALKQKLVENREHGISLEEIGQYFKLDDSTLIALPTMDSLFNTNQIDAALASWGEFTSSLAAVHSVLQQQGGGARSYDDIVNAMNLEDTGGWYFGALSLVFLLVLSVANSGSISEKRHTIVMTEASLPASSGDVSQSVVLATSVVDERGLVNEQVIQLKAATAEVMEQLREMKAEKHARAYEVATMQSELRVVMNRLDANLQEEIQLKLSLAKTQAKLEQETQYLRNQLNERVAVEEELRHQLDTTKAKLAQEMDKVKRAKQQAEKEVASAEAEVKKLEQQKSKMEQEMIALRNEMKKLKTQLATQKDDQPKQQQEQQQEPVPVLLNSTPHINGVNGDASNRNQLSGNGSGTSTMTKPKTAIVPTKKRLPTTSYMDLSDAFFAAIAEPVVQPSSSSSQALSSSQVRGVTAKPPTAGSKRIVAKRIIAKKLVRRPDWSGMTMAALKRKTVKELADYLEAKGEPTTGPDGKLLRKDILVENVLSK